MSMMPKIFRIIFLLMAAVLFLGIYLTGFNQVHWFLYVPLVILVFAAATGICPSYIVLKKTGV